MLPVSFIMLTQASNQIWSTRIRYVYKLWNAIANKLDDTGVLWILDGAGAKNWEVTMLKSELGFLGVSKCWAVSYPSKLQGPFHLVQNGFVHLLGILQKLRLLRPIYFKNREFHLDLFQKNSNKQIHCPSPLSPFKFFKSFGLVSVSVPLLRFLESCFGGALPHPFFLSGLPVPYLQ